MRFATVCSGIEAPGVAWDPLGWEQAWCSEIDKFCCELLKQRHPNVPNLGDMTAADFIERAKRHGPIDVFVGGTPCQSFSVAGLRGGLDDARGNLALRFLQLADALRPRWLVWENVPGVLSSNGGRDFGAILGGMVELGYGFAYRILDAQYFGVAQRRRRVFVVGCAGDWRGAAAVLFESHSLSGDHPPRREKGSRAAYCLAAGAGGGKFGTGRDGQDDFVISHTLKASNGGEDGTGRGVPLVPCDVIPIDMQQASRGATMTNNRNGSSGGAPGTGVGEPGDPAPSLSMSHPPAIAYQCQGSNIGEMGTLRAGNGNTAGGVPFVVFAQNQRDEVRTMDVVGALAAESGMKQQTYVLQTGVRRLLPVECEKLQGFEPGYTDVTYRGKPAADGPRYRSLGNSMAVPVMAWIGRRIQMVEQSASRE